LRWKRKARFRLLDIAGFIGSRLPKEKLESTGARLPIDGCVAAATRKRFLRRWLGPRNARRAFDTLDCAQQNVAGDDVEALGARWRSDRRSQAIKPTAPTDLADFKRSAPEH
jgi:hypothetical protein